MQSKESSTALIVASLSSSLGKLKIFSVTVWKRQWRHSFSVRTLSQCISEVQHFSQFFNYVRMYCGRRILRNKDIIPSLHMQNMTMRQSSKMYLLLACSYLVFKIHKQIFLLFSDKSVKKIFLCSLLHIGEDSVQGRKHPISKTEIDRKNWYKLV